MGQSVERLTHGVAHAEFPSWSSDGQWVYFSSQREPKGIWRVPSKGGTPTKVDGREIARSLDGASVFYADFSGVWKELAEGGERVEVPELRGMYHRLVGKKIYFVRKEPGPGFSIWLYDLSTANARRLVTIEKEFGWGFSVSPHGDSLLYCQSEPEEADIMLVDNFR